MRFHRLFDSDQFVHERLVDLQASRGIDDQNVVASALRFFFCLECDVLCDLVVAVGKDRNIDRLADDLELIDRRRSVDIAGREHRLFAVFLEICRELAAGGGLTGTLQTDHQECGKSARCIGQLAVGAAHHFDQLVVYDFDYLLPRRQTRKNVLSHRLLLDFSDELFDNLEVDVRFEQRQLDLPHGVVDVRLRQYALAAQFLKGIL